VSGSAFDQSSKAAPAPYDRLAAGALVEPSFAR